MVFSIVPASVFQSPVFRQVPRAWRSQWSHESDVVETRLEAERIRPENTIAFTKEPDQAGAEQQEGLM